MDAAHASRRGLLRALTVMPIAGIPLSSPDVPGSDWQAALQVWLKVEADLLPIRDRFDAAEKALFAARTDPLAAAEHASAMCDHENQLDLCDAALQALLDARVPDMSAVLFKLELVADRILPEAIEALRFLPADLRAIDRARVNPVEGGKHALL